MFTCLEMMNAFKHCNCLTSFYPKFVLKNEGKWVKSLDFLYGYLVDMTWSAPTRCSKKIPGTRAEPDDHTIPESPNLISYLVLGWKNEGVA